jgi:hypothetical protein
VLCCDSMVTLTSYTPDGVVYTNFEHAEKLICLGEHLPAAVMISGMPSIAGELISVVIQRMARRHEAAGSADGPNTVQAVRDAVDPAYRTHLPQVKVSAAGLLSRPESLAKINVGRQASGLPDLAAITPDMIHIRDDPADPFDATRHVETVEATLTLVVASYFGDDPLATVVTWPGPREERVVPDKGKRVLYWGSGSLPIARLLLGYDKFTLAQAADLNTDAAAAQDFFRRFTRAFAMPAPEPQMPLQTAVHFAEFLGGVASDYDHFSAGPSFVGGELDLMVLTPGKREWVYQKRIRSRRERRL